MDEEKEILNEDNTCPQCGLRQYSNFCVNCQIEIEDTPEEENKKEDDADEYDWREKR